MSKKAGIAFVFLGAVLIVSALLLFLFNRYEDSKAGREADRQLAGVEAAIPMRTSEPSGAFNTTESTSLATLDPELPVVELDGYGYVGYVELPTLELKLPVMSEWDYERLKIAPCRQFGSSRTDDLVIAAHNYNKHFGRLKNLKVGDRVTFTDMEGLVNTYSVAQVSTIEPTEVEAVQNSGYALVLYSCTKDGRTRVTVFCARVQ